jgi:hypothetical protein
MQTARSTDAEHVFGLVASLRALAGAHVRRLGLLVLADQGEEAAAGDITKWRLQVLSTPVRDVAPSAI